ncbi:hypothetical protein CFP65_2616 [Kitasatospora sp. MMS16-BH015]|uniref:hypothetical protein n=1 Tax=Kitasatospora sp. MMS16-BH015 TaxID=2018025 RepID=UPI000CA2F271|nr:hypothetical protein [Kitasatospora sp. MMS16-BH015]AUG77441.1 hypothetical protein CFP65_2616 [Kitasatospora sp. MMS16-BH015]
MPRTHHRPAVLALTVLALLASAGPAVAHGDSVHLAVSNPAGGQPHTVATWENDGDPVTEPLAATLTAVSPDGRRVGPWQLVHQPDGSYATADLLPAGRWHLTVEAGFPALGRTETDLTVSAQLTDPSTAFTPTATAAPTPTATPKTPTPTTAATAPGPARQQRGATGWLVLAAGAALGAVALLVIRRRRRS